MEFKKPAKPTFDTPLGKIKLPLSNTQMNVCLAMTGSFFPIHNNHIRTLEKVKEHLTKIYNYNVIGGYIIPTHNSSLKKKLGDMFIPPIKRLKMCQVAVEDSTWINIDPYLIMQPKKIPVGQSKKHLEEVLNTYIKSQNQEDNDEKQTFKLIPVMGVDNISLVEWRLEKETFIFVQNRTLPSTINLEEWVNSEKFKSYGNNAILIKDEDVPYEISSTILREKIAYGKPVDTYMDPKVIDYIIKDEAIMKIFVALQKDHELKLVNQQKREEALKLGEQGAMTQEQYLTEFGIKLDVNPEVLRNVLDFSFLSVPIEKLKPEYSNGRLLQLGKGIAGTVWAMRLNKIPVAVKFFSLSQQKSRRINNLRLELRALTRIEHKNVIKCYGAGAVGNAVYIVLERASPISAWDFVSQNANEWSTKGYSLRWIKGWADLSDGLQAMSDAGVLHRDLQLDNILIFNGENQNGMAIAQEQKKEETDKSNVSNEDKKEEEKEATGEERLLFKIADFGVSSLEEDKDKVIRGSIRHYAPEAFHDKVNYTSASDVYSFSMVMWEMIHGKRIWADLPTPEVTKKIDQGERPPFEVPCHEKIKHIMNLCWAQNPKDRPTFGEVSKQLNQVYIELSKESK